MSALPGKRNKSQDQIAKYYAGEYYNGGKSALFTFYERGEISRPNELYAELDSLERSARDHNRMANEVKFLKDYIVGAGLRPPVKGWETIGKPKGF